MASRIVLRGDQVGELKVVSHPDAPADYVDSQSIWRHVNPQAFSRVDGEDLPVYDRLAKAAQ